MVSIWIIYDYLIPWLIRIPDPSRNHDSKKNGARSETTATFLEDHWGWPKRYTFYSSPSETLNKIPEGVGWPIWSYHSFLPNTVQLGYIYISIYTTTMKYMFVHIWISNYQIITGAWSPLSAMKVTFSVGSSRKSSKSSKNPQENQENYRIPIVFPPFCPQKHPDFHPSPAISPVVPGAPWRPRRRARCGALPPKVTTRLRAAKRRLEKIWPTPKGWTISEENLCG